MDRDGGSVGGRGRSGSPLVELVVDALAAGVADVAAKPHGQDVGNRWGRHTLPHRSLSMMRWGAVSEVARWRPARSRTPDSRNGTRGSNGWAGLSSACSSSARRSVCSAGRLSLSSVASSDGSVQVAYYRFARLGADGVVAPEAVTDDVVRVRRSRSHPDQMTINAITPSRTLWPLSLPVCATSSLPNPGPRADDRVRPDALTGLWSKHAEIAVGDRRSTSSGRPLPSCASPTATPDRSA